MKDYFGKKTVGFHITTVATLLAAISLIFYASATDSLTNVFILVIGAILIEVLLFILSAVLGNKHFLELASSICAVLMSAGITLSLTTQVDALGYLVSGLYGFDDMKSFILFAALGIVAMVLYIVASFMGLGKDHELIKVEA